MSRNANRPVSRGSVGLAAKGDAIGTDVTLSGRPMSNHGMESGERVQTGKR